MVDLKGLRTLGIIHAMMDAPRVNERHWRCIYSKNGKCQKKLGRCDGSKTACKKKKVER